jgi:hypothetical protein
MGEVELNLQCDHKYVHLETSRWHDSGGGYQTRWVRIDRFFCERCLKTRELRRDEYSREQPEWYR